MKGAVKMANEKRLIDANATVAEIKQNVCKNCNSHNGIRCDYCWADDVIDFLQETPTVDAVPVVHGYWIDSYSVDHMGRIIEHSIDCSVCDSVFKDDSREVVKHWKERFKVCPFCGAVMDGGNEDV
jgi:hypothetical protein